MKQRYIILSFLILLGSVYAVGQTLKGYIISIEGRVVNVDFTRTQVKTGDHLEVVVNGGYITHPVTKRRVKKEDEVIGTLVVDKVYGEYSTAYPIDSSLLPQLKAGMDVRLLEKVVDVQPSSDSRQQSSNRISRNEIMVNTFTSSGKREDSEIDSQDFLNGGRSSNKMEKVNIVIAPAQVNDVVHNGHFGGYVADILMEQMLMCDKIRLLDRSVLNAQIDEVNLAGDILDQTTTIQRGRGIGARYILQTTLQKPDVANVRTGIPLASVMGAVQGLTRTDIGAAYGSNVNIATLKASVSLSVRVVDLETGEVVFMCSGSGKAQGKAQLSLEYGALGGGELNGGAEDFKQTITGKAIKQAFISVGRNLRDFFDGRVDKKVMGSIGGGASYGERMYARGYKLYLGTQRLGKDEIPNIFTGQYRLFSQYKKALKKKRTSWWVGIGGTLVMCAAGAGLSSSSGTIGVGYGVMAVGLVGGITMGCTINKSGKRVMQSVADSYNNNNTYGYTKPTGSKFLLSFSPTGLRLTF